MFLILEVWYFIYFCPTRHQIRVFLNISALVSSVAKFYEKEDRSCNYERLSPFSENTNNIFRLLWITRSVSLKTRYADAE